MTEDNRTIEIIDAYKSFIKNVLIELAGKEGGIKSEEELDEEINAMIEFESKLAQVCLIKAIGF
jgi:hypothetical protein